MYSMLSLPLVRAAEGLWSQAAEQWKHKKPVSSAEVFFPGQQACDYFFILL